MHDKIIIDTFDESKFGDEAQAILQSRNFFPGIGGDILTTQPAPVAMRVEHWPIPDTGYKLFLVHLILKKLDDYFCRMRKYRTPHITRPFGSISDANKKLEAYMYEWVFGEEGFSWEDGPREPIQLEEWGAFVVAFDEAGIQINDDVARVDDGRVSKNIIHYMPKVRDACLNRFWMRIDFGPKSLPISYNRLEAFLHTHAESLRDFLSENRNESINRYDLLLLAHTYITRRDALSERDMGKLEMLTRVARVSQLKQFKPKIV